MTRNEILEYILSLNSVQLDILRARLNVQSGILPGGGAAPAQTAIRLFEYFEQPGRSLKELEAVLKADFITATQNSKPQTSNTNTKPRGIKIFIVHGWNHVILNELVLFIQNDMGFKVEIMKDKAMQGRTLPEKFEQIANNVSHAIILVTADEELAKSSDSAAYRARPNVILEIGYFWGRLGRDRITLLVDKNVEIPSDLQGMGYIPISNEFDSVKFKLQKELMSADHL